jgi:hypothetical protein
VEGGNISSIIRTQLSDHPRLESSADQSKMVLLTDLPPEIILNVLSFVDPSDLAIIPPTCKALNYAIKGNSTLFKHVYLAHLDTPASKDVDWEQALKNVVRLQVVCGSDGVENKVRSVHYLATADC